MLGKSSYTKEKENFKMACVRKKKNGSYEIIVSLRVQCRA